MIAEVSGQTTSSVETAGVLLEKKKKELRGLLLLQLAQKISSEKSSKIDALIAKEPELSREIAELELRVREEGFLLDEEGQESENQPEPSKGLKERFLKRMRGLFAGGKNWFADYMGDELRERKLIAMPQGQLASDKQNKKAEKAWNREHYRSALDVSAAIAGAAINYFLVKNGLSGDLSPYIALAQSVATPLAALALPGADVADYAAAYSGDLASRKKQEGRESASAVSSSVSALFNGVSFGLRQYGANVGTIRCLGLGLGIGAGVATAAHVGGIAVEHVPAQVDRLVDSIQNTLGQDSDSLRAGIGDLIDGLHSQSQEPASIGGVVDQSSEADRAQNWAVGSGSSSDQSSASGGTDTGEGGIPSGGQQEMGSRENPDATGNVGSGSNESSEPNQSADGANQQISQEVQAEHQPAITFDREAAEAWQNYPEDPTQRAVITSMADLHESLFNPDGTLNVEQATAFRDHFGIPQTTPISEQTLKDFGPAIHYAGVESWSELTPEQLAQQQSNPWLYGPDGHSKFNLTVPPGSDQIFKVR